MGAAQLVAAAVLAAGPLAAARQAGAAVPQEPPNAIDQEAEARGQAVRLLSIEDALRIGRSGNVPLRAAELLPEQARTDLLFAEAAFAPELYVNGNYSDSRAPQRNAFQPSVQRTTIDGAMGWRQRTITGGAFDLAFRPARIEARGSPAFPAKLHTAEWGATFRQPLLRGGWTEYNLAASTSAQLGMVQAEQDFQRTVQDTLMRIVQAYWELAFSRANWRVVDAALAVAQEQLRITDERIKVQALAPRDRIADEAELARRREERIAAENDIRAREDELRRLLFDATDPELWRINLRPSSEIAIEPKAEARDFAPLVQIAVQKRPDLDSLRTQISAAEVALAQAQNETLPRFDFVGGWSSDAARTEFRDTWNDAIDNTYPDWNVGFEFALPLGNRAAQARQLRAMLDLEQRRRRLHAAVLDVTKEVRDAVRSLDSLAQSIAAGEVSVRLATANLETEQVKLRVGASTAFEVQRRNQELREARTRLLRNQLDYRVAESRLLHAQGLLAAPQ
ncbi:MAG: TolC family protein [Planctomycetes bacterium]|nr:TolC family protein [Planctomycetota bacterium]